MRLFFGIQMPPPFVAVAGAAVVGLGVWRGNPIVIVVGLVVIAIAALRAFVL